MQFSSPPPSPVVDVIQGYLPLIVLAVAAPMLVQLFRPLRKGGKRMRTQARAATERKRKEKVGALQRAEQGSFSKKGLFNKSELRIFHLLEDEIKSAALPLRVMGQTSLRGFLETDSQSYFALGERRADFVVADAEGNVALVVEYNGEGHFQNEPERRDAIKSIAFGKAGIPFLTIEAGESDALIRERLRHKLGVKAAAG
jgi:hypothetical protein